MLAAIPILIIAIIWIVTLFPNSKATAFVRKVCWWFLAGTTVALAVTGILQEASFALWLAVGLPPEISPGWLLLAGAVGWLIGMLTAPNIVDEAEEEYYREDGEADYVDKDGKTWMDAFLAPEGEEFDRSKKAGE